MEKALLWLGLSLLILGVIGQECDPTCVDEKYCEEGVCTECGPDHYSNTNVYTIDTCIKKEWYSQSGMGIGLGFVIGFCGTCIIIAILFFVIRSRKRKPKERIRLIEEFADEESELSDEDIIKLEEGFDNVDASELETSELSEEEAEYQAVDMDDVSEEPISEEKPKSESEEEEKPPSAAESETPPESESPSSSSEEESSEKKKKKSSSSASSSSASSSSSSKKKKSSSSSSSLNSSSS